jgi:hypothetical protein
MDFQNEKSGNPQKNFNKVKRASLSQQLMPVSLREVSLKERHKEAEKPLFLIRYE